MIHWIWLQNRPFSLDMYIYLCTFSLSLSTMLKNTYQTCLMSFFLSSSSSSECSLPWCWSTSSWRASVERPKLRKCSKWLLSCAGPFFPGPRDTFWWPTPHYSWSASAQIPCCLEPGTQQAQILKMAEPTYEESSIELIQTVCQKTKVTMRDTIYINTGIGITMRIQTISGRCKNIETGRHRKCKTTSRNLNITNCDHKWYAFPSRQKKRTW